MATIVSVGSNPSLPETRENSACSRGPAFWQPGTSLRMLRSSPHHNLTSSSNADSVMPIARRVKLVLKLVLIDGSRSDNLREMSGYNNKTTWATSLTIIGNFCGLDTAHVASLERLRTS